MLIDLTNSGSASNPNVGTLNATSTNGSINVSDQSGSIQIGQVIASQTTGNVALAADLSILAANASSKIEGGAVDLTASFGSVGSLGTGGTADAPAAGALAIVVDVGAASVDNLAVTSEGDVFVRQSTGDLRIDQIDSSVGNIRVEVPDGNLVDANNISVPDTQNLSALEGRWAGMLATQSTAQISVTDTVTAYENQIDQEYQTYWMFRDEQPNPSVFDPTFQVTLPAGQLAAWTAYYTGQGTVEGLSGTALTTFVNNALAALASADNEEYRSDNAIFGKLGNSFNPNFMYFANQTPLSGSVTLTLGPADIDSTGYLIDLPGNGYVTGQPLVYHANGGSVGGLIDGTTYYAIVDPADSNEISLAATYEDATDSNPIQLSTVTGTDNVLSTIFQTFGASQVDPTGLSIDLPQNVFTTGQAVIYHANGGSVAGLTDGDTYYVIVDPNNTGSSAFIGLASSLANATASPRPDQAHQCHGHGQLPLRSRRRVGAGGMEPEPVAKLDEPQHRRAGVVPLDRPGDSRPQFGGQERRDRRLGQHRHGYRPGYNPAATFECPPAARGPRPGRRAACGYHVLQCRPEQHAGSRVAERPHFNPVELTINLQKGISLENTGVVDATAGQNIFLESGQDVANQGALLPITLDLVTAGGGVSSGHPKGVVRILGLAGIVTGRTAGDININGGNLFLEGGDTGGIGTGLRPSTWTWHQPHLEEANAELSVSSLR